MREQFIQAAYDNLLTKNSPQAAQPEHIGLSLRPHQLSLLAAARSLEQHAHTNEIRQNQHTLLTSYGVIADRVGAGKSLVALSLVKDPPIVRSFIHMANSGRASSILFSNGEPQLTPIPEIDDNQELFEALRTSMSFPFQVSVAGSLIVAPHTTCAQWEDYIRNQTTLNAVIIRKRRDCDASEPKFLYRLLTADVVLVSSTMMLHFQREVHNVINSLSRIYWSRVFIDEADTISANLAGVRGGFVWFITGSWMNMLFPRGLHTGQIRELNEGVRQQVGNGTISGVIHRCGLVLETITKEENPIFTRLILRNSTDWLDESLQTPLVHSETIVCAAPANLRALRGYISEEAMEALHAGDTTAALGSLGLEPVSATSLVEQVSERLHQQIQQAKLTLAFKQELIYSSPVAKEQALKKATEKVERLEQQMSTLGARLTEAAAADNCPICYDTPNCPALTPCCQQKFCLSCLCQCIVTKKSCPLCRAPIRDVRGLTVIGETANGGAGTPADPTKGATLLRLLTESDPADKILVFSAHDRSFAGVREVLEGRGVTSATLNGASTRIQSVCRGFQKGGTRVLFMNAKSVGAGLNLDAATDIIFYHRMNAEMERQIIGRAIRFDRTRELRVIYLTHAGETGLTADVNVIDV